MKLIELNESLDSAYPYEIKRRYATFFSAFFETPNGRVNVMFDKDIAREEDEASRWELVFTREVISKEQPNDIAYTTGKTGQGNELQVFATVLVIVQEFIQRYHPDIVEFTSDKEDGNRSSLYTRLVKRHLPKGYEVEYNEVSTATYFTVKRVPKS